mmetsp:Transcript_20560/g.52243  ORF Transcript_20560/g.52243 Transcript_20560/m.52243 type:complete len:225 (-) Transcript_20560:656-1330(-)
MRHGKIPGVATRDTELCGSHRRAIDSRPARTAVLSHLSEMDHLLRIRHMLGAGKLRRDTASHRLALFSGLFELPVLPASYVEGDLVHHLAAESVTTLTAVRGPIRVHNIRRAHDRVLQLRRSATALGLAHCHSGVESSSTCCIVRGRALQIVTCQDVSLLALHVTLPMLRSVSFRADFSSMGDPSRRVALHEVALRSAEPLTDVEITDQRVVHQGIARLAHDRA